MLVLRQWDRTTVSHLVDILSFEHVKNTIPSSALLSHAVVALALLFWNVHIDNPKNKYLYSILFMVFGYVLSENTEMQPPRPPSNSHVPDLHYFYNKRYAPKKLLYVTLIILCFHLQILKKIRKYEANNLPLSIGIAIPMVTGIYVLAFGNRI